MNIFSFSFTISLQIKNKRYELNFVKYCTQKLGEIFEEFSFQTLEVFFFNISGWGVFHTSYKIENFETRLVCEKHLLQFFCLFSSLSWYLVLYFSYSTFWGVKRALCKQNSSIEKIGRETIFQSRTFCDCLCFKSQLLGQSAVWVLFDGKFVLSKNNLQARFKAAFFTLGIICFPGLFFECVHSKARNFHFCNHNFHKL